MGANQSNAGAHDVLTLLNSREWQELSGSRVQDVRRKLELIDRLGVPPMRVLPSAELRRLRLLPRSDCARTVDARAALENRGVIMFCSHRWLRPDEGRPDNALNRKARVLAMFGEWYERKYTGRNIYWWLDWCCIDQDDPLPGVRALPLYVAASNDIMCYETADYDARAWCQVERIVAFTFMASGRVPWVVCDSSALDAALRLAGPVGVRVTREPRLLVDPSGCKLSTESDREPVEGLKMVALRAKVATDERRLEFGVTSIDASVCIFGMEGSDHP